LTGQSDTWQVDACRAKEGQCPFALTALSDLKTQLEAVLSDSDGQKFFRAGACGTDLPHQRLRVALAACPNACTQPQIKDIGVIACLEPRGVRSDCTGCGRCVEACKEGAISMEGELARLTSGRCVGCGLCLPACSQGAIEARELRFRVLVGGRLGRHPKWALELPEKVAPSRLSEVAGRLLSGIIRNAGNGERFSAVVERLGTDHLHTMTDPQGRV
jgi:dissimilatory sulfite reductase (desulfoviridin) alpha/beta subunit